MPYSGIDVSQHQGRIDWGMVAKSGIRYAMLRIASSNENGLYIDIEFTRNIREAAKNGVKVGVYWYTYATTIKQLRKEWEFVFAELKKHKLQMPVAYDIEYEPSILALPKSERTKLAAEACRLIEAAGYYAMIYCSCDFYKSKLDYKKLAKYDVWIAHYKGTTHDDCPVEPGIWQYSSRGYVPGMACNFDLDIFYKAYDKICKPVGGDLDNPVAPSSKAALRKIIVGPMSNGDYDTIKPKIDKIAAEIGNISVNVEEV